MPEFADDDPSDDVDPNEDPEELDELDEVDELELVVEVPVAVEVAAYAWASCTPTPPAARVVASRMPAVHRLVAFSARLPCRVVMTRDLGRASQGDPVSSLCRTDDWLPLLSMPNHPRRNRVTPTGKVVAIPLRGAWMGNRGILQNEDGAVVRNHATKAWITCRLSFRNRVVPQWDPHHYTVLFLHDEAVSFAAGHRPCAECRHDAYRRFRQAIADGEETEPLSAKEIDARLHEERLIGRTRTRRLWSLPWADLPSGAFVVHDDHPYLVRPDDLVPWTSVGYGDPVLRPRRGEARVLTPPISVAAFRGGYVPQVDPAAAEERSGSGQGPVRDEPNCAGRPAGTR